MARCQAGELPEAVEDEQSRRRVREEINALTEVERCRLHLYALRLSRRCADDLYQEAMLRVISGRRRWPPENDSKLPFVYFLMGVLRSVASSWEKDPYEGKRSQEPDVTGPRSDAAHNMSRLETMPSAEISPEDRAIHNELVHLLKEECSDKTTARVLKALLRGLKRSEILRQSHLTLKQYGTIYKRLQRRVRSIREATR